jgi:hypothetical protein
VGACGGGGTRSGACGGASDYDGTHDTLMGGGGGNLKGGDGRSQGGRSDANSG